MKISVVIPAYNEEKYLPSCLTSLIQQSEAADEIIVVDNNCTDRTIEIAKEFPVRIVKETTQGMIPARNKGFDSAHYEIIARTDADAILPLDWIQRIKADFAQNPHLVAVSGPQQFDTNPLVGEISRWPTALYISVVKLAIGHDFLIGPNMAIRKSAWEKIRGTVCLDDKAVHEDQDLSLHLTPVGDIYFDDKLIILASIRRWKKIKPYFEYPYRSIRTIQSHRLSRPELTRSKTLRTLAQTLVTLTPILSLAAKPIKKTKKFIQDSL